MALIQGTNKQIPILPLLLMAVGGIVGALIGSAISKRMKNVQVEKFFRILLIVIFLINCWNIVKFLL